MEHQGELSGLPKFERGTDDSWNSAKSVATLEIERETPTVSGIENHRMQSNPTLGQEVLRSLDFIVFQIVVAGLSCASFFWLSARFGNDEARDRWFYLSLLVIAECAYWGSRLFTRKTQDVFGPGTQTFFRRSGVDGWFYLTPAVFGSAALLVLAPVYYPAVGAVFGLLAYQFLRDKVRALRWLELVEVPVSAFIVYQGMLWMALLPSKELHHWSFYLGPAQSVFQGGHLLWDVPSQYGFLSIWTIATLAKIFGTTPITSMWAVVEGLQLTAVLLGVYVFRFRLGLSTVVSAVLSVSVLLCLPGLEWYLGPVCAPSISALRFLPSLLALICVDRAVRSPSTWGTVLSAIFVAVSCLWSAESCMYTIAPIGIFAFLSFAKKPSLSFFKSTVLKISALALLFASMFIMAYAWSLPFGIDPTSFYEFAQAYASHKGVLPIDVSAWIWTWTWLFVFMISTAYFIARGQFVHGGSSASQGSLFFVFLFCIGTYYIARSSYRNVQNIVPWFLIAIGAMVAGASGRKAQRSMIFVIASLSLVCFCSLYGPDNKSRIAERSRQKSLYVPPIYSMIPSEVATAARKATNSSLFTFIHFDSLYGYSPEIDSYGNALPISPLNHFVTPHDQRVRLYTKRMLERVPESFVLCESRVCPGVPYVFREMGSFIEVSQVPYEFSSSWPIYRLTRKG